MRRALLILLSFTPLLCATAQETTQDRTAHTPGETLGEVTRLGGSGARVQRAGSKEWQPLNRGDAVKAGDRVDAGKAGVELLFPRGKGPAKVGERVALGKKARVAIPLDGEADLDLEEGDLFALSQDELRVRAGRNVVTVRGGDAELKRKARGDLEVLAHYGFVAVVVGGEHQVLEPGKKIKIDAKGKAGPTRSFKVKDSKWLRSMNRVDPRRVQFHETFAEVPSAGYEQTNATIADGAAIGAPGDKYFSQSVHLEAYHKGLFTTQDGSVLRLRYRLSAPVKDIKLQGWAKGPKQNYVARISPVRVGVWTDVEVPLALFTGNSSKARVKVETTFHDFSVFAGKVGSDVVLEVDELLVYQPR